MKDDIEATRERRKEWIKWTTSGSAIVIIIPIVK